MAASGGSFSRGGPLVSVVIPFQNAAAYLAEALDSVLRQTYESFEVLMVNDGSTDEGLDIIDRFRDSRITVLGDHHRRGLAFRLNQGIDAASGKYIARMDADDISASRRLECQVSKMESDDQLAVLGSAAAYIDESGKVIGAPRQSPLDDHQIRWRLLTSNCIFHPSVMLRASVVKNHGYSTEYPVAQDYEFWLRLAASNHRFATLPEVLVLIRRHAVAVTSTRRVEQVEYAAKALASHLRSRFGLIVDLSIATALVTPPLLAGEGPLSGESPLRVLGEAAARLSGTSEDSGKPAETPQYVKDDILHYALRYMFRAIRNRPEGRTLHEVVGLGEAIRTILLRSPAAVRVAADHFLARKRSVSAGVTIVRERTSARYPPS